jgi:hypothetical protein
VTHKSQINNFSISILKWFSSWKWQYTAWYSLCANEMIWHNHLLLQNCYIVIIMAVLLLSYEDKNNLKWKLQVLQTLKKKFKIGMNLITSDTLAFCIIGKKKLAEYEVHSVNSNSFTLYPTVTSLQFQRTLCEWRVTTLILGYGTFNAQSDVYPTNTRACLKAA